MPIDGRTGKPLSSSETQEIIPPPAGLLNQLPAEIREPVSRDSTISECLIHGRIERDIAFEDIQGSILKKQEGEKYKRHREIARGGMGLVLDAHDLHLRRNVAMKVILAPRRASKSRVLRFVQEAQVTAQLQHPGVMPIYELGVDRDGNVYYTMKRVTGKTLKQILNDLKAGKVDVVSSWPLVRLLNVLQRVCDTIAYAHSKGVVHRDLKPDNIMIGDYGEVLVLDWGLAKLLTGRDAGIEGGEAACDGNVNRPDVENVKELRDALMSARDESDETSNLLLTTDGNVIGTPGYMSPEQARGESAAIDQRSDIYALGAMLYHIIMLSPPIFWDKSMDKLKVLEQIRAGRIDRPEASDRVPGSLIAVTMKAMALRPDDRYQTATEFQSDIEAYQAGFVTSAEDWSVWKIVRLFVLRHKVTSLAVAVFLMLLVAGLSINVTERLRAELAEKEAVSERVRAETALEALKATTPALVLLSDSYLSKKDFKSALKIISQAVDLTPANCEAHLKKANLLQMMYSFKEAFEEYSKVLKLDPTNNMASVNLDLCRQWMETVDARTMFLSLRDQDRISEALGVIMSLKKTPEVLRVFLKELLDRDSASYRDFWVDSAGNCGLDCSGAPVVDLSSLKGLPLVSLNLHECADVEDLSPLKDMPLARLDLGKCRKIVDLSPLSGMPLVWLDLSGCRKIEDLSPLRGMKLEKLNIAECDRIADLSPLKDVPLERLSLSNCTSVADLMPLQGMPLTWLNLGGCVKVEDLTPLCGMPLKWLELGGCPAISDLSALNGMTMSYLSLRGCSGVTNLLSLRDLEVEILAIDAGLASNSVDVVHEMKTLRTINETPASQFR